MTPRGVITGAYEIIALSGDLLFENFKPQTWNGRVVDLTKKGPRFVPKDFRCR